MNPEKRITIRNAVFVAFHEMDEVFSVIKLEDRVRYFRKQPKLQDDSIKKRLRELRLDHIINYEVEGNKYKKLEVIKAVEPPPRKPKKAKRIKRAEVFQLALF